MQPTTGEAGVPDTLPNLKSTHSTIVFSLYVASIVDQLLHPETSENDDPANTSGDPGAPLMHVASRALEREITRPLIGTLLRLPGM